MPEWMLFSGLGAFLATITNAVLITVFVRYRQRQDKRFWENRE